MIHADLHQGNLLVNGQFMTVIDFDDAGFGWYLYDLAVALTHQEDRPGFQKLQDALLRGYRSRRPLSEVDEARLPMFLLVRRLAILGWLHQRPDVDPGDRFFKLKATALARCEAFMEPT
jgi:Ser/Thr protein kinase RdoA (MazF antagonist)